MKYKYPPSLLIVLEFCLMVTVTFGTIYYFRELLFEQKSFELFIFTLLFGLAGVGLATILCHALIKTVIEIDKSKRRKNEKST